MRTRLLLALLLLAACKTGDGDHYIKHEGGGGVIDADLLEVRIERPANASRTGTYRQMIARVDISNISHADIVVKKIELDQRGFGSGVMLESAITAFRERIEPGRSHEFTVYGRGQVDMDAADLPPQSQSTLTMRCIVTLENNDSFKFDFEIPYVPELR